MKSEKQRQIEDATVQIMAGSMGEFWAESVRRKSSEKEITEATELLAESCALAAHFALKAAGELKLK